MAHIYYLKRGSDRFLLPPLIAENYEYIGEVEHEDLELIFRAMNGVDGSDIEKHLKEFKCRSLSVGDVVDCEHGVFICENNGWKNLHDDPETLEFGRAMETVLCEFCSTRAATSEPFSCDQCNVKECKCGEIINLDDLECRQCHDDGLAEEGDRRRKHFQEEGY